MSGQAHGGEQLTVSVFMEIDTSLRTWEGLGVLDRETKYYRRLAQMGLRINLIAYGERSENDYPSHTQGIRVLCNRLGIRRRTYQRRLFQIHALPLLRSHILRTHNTHAMLATMRAQWAWRIPLVFRTGYSWSISAAANPKNSQSYIREARAYERELFSQANLILPANDVLAQGIIEQVPAAAGKITVIPTYVDCDLFRPMATEKRFDLVYIGRLSGIKNLEATLAAVERSGKTIAIIGGGALDSAGFNRDAAYEAKLKERFGDNGRMHWLGMIPNEDLPAYINQAKALILCSHSEGHPRSMIEAMACGVPVIGSRVGGLAATLQHKITGYLCETDADSIAAAIDSVLSQPRLIDEMGANARKFALENNSLPKVAQREYDLLADVARRNPVESIPRRLADYVFRPRR